jgi:hypothetical protein
MKNKIYYGDNLDVLRRYIKDETVDLCYIDPPFNSKRNYNQIYNNIGKEDAAQAQAFTDTWTWDDVANQGLAEIKSNYNGVFTEQSIDLICGLEKVLKKGALFAYLVSMTLRIAEISGVPKDFESAVALANKSDDKTRKEFEKWMVLRYSDNQAIINEKKGGDGGIDGVAYIPDHIVGKVIEFKKVIFSVKSNAKLTSAVTRELFGAVERENAAIGILLTLYPMPNLVKDSNQYGLYFSEFNRRDYQKIQVVCVDDIFNGAFMALPNVEKVVKKAEQKITEQKDLF